MDEPPDNAFPPGLDPPEACGLRNDMVETQLAARGIRDRRVLDAMRRVPRHLFCEAGTPLEETYGDFPLPVGHGQTISQPWMVACMLQCLKLTGGETVLEIGTGSGYNAALLSLLVHRTLSVEVIPALAESARRRLAALGYAVECVAGDGSLGWPAAAPYDAIVVTAGAPDVPSELKEQLRHGGRLVIPVGDRHIQELVVIRRETDGFSLRPCGGCRFVPLTGRHGWR